MSKEEIEFIVKQFGIINYYINNDGYVNVNGDVQFSGFNLKKLPIKFNIINGNFNISGNSLETLENCPNKIIGNAIFSFNNLKDLNYCTPIIKGSLIVNGNRLKTLKGAPKKIGQVFSCELNKTLNSLEYAPISSNILTDGTSIPEVEKYIYLKCIKHGIWNNTNSVEQNLLDLLEKDQNVPEILKQWIAIKIFRSF